MACCICHESYSPFSLRQFHRFPADIERRQKWFDSIGKPVSNYKTTTVCSDHFIQNDYYYTGTSVYNIRLKKTAIPSVLIQRNEKKDSGSTVQNENQELISSESAMGVEYQYITDQQPTINNQCNNILANSELTLVKKNVTNQNRKQHKDNIEKIFVKSGKYNTECIKKTDFTSSCTWMTFLKYVKYQRYLLKRFAMQKSQAQKKIITLQSIVKTLKSKNLITRNIVHAVQDVVSRPVEELLIRLVNKRKTKFPHSLRCFAVTLHFHSPTAYPTCLPHVFHMSP